MKLYKLTLIIFTLFINSAIADPYFKGTLISPKLIDKPFKVGSSQWENEINQVKNVQSYAKKEDIDQAAKEKELRPETIVLQINPKLVRSKFPKLYQLLDRVSETSRETTGHIKEYWGIKRPYLTDKSVMPLIPASNGYSYPSGHTTGSYIYAHVLSLIMPKKDQKLKDIAQTIAWHRVLAGMHYPQDLEGGKQLSLVLYGGLIQNSEFNNDLEEAKKELSEAGII